RAAERSKRDGRPAMKQRSAELALEGADGVGQRRLRHAAAFGCEGEALLLAQRQEIADLVHLHGSIWPRGFRSHRTMPSNGTPESDPRHAGSAFIFALEKPACDVRYFTLDRVDQAAPTAIAMRGLRIQLAHVECGDRAAEALELELAHGFELRACVHGGMH